MTDQLDTIATLLGVLVYLELRAFLARSGIAPRRVSDHHDSAEG